jgi:hypothetical protein
MDKVHKLSSNNDFKLYCIPMKLGHGSVVVKALCYRLEDHGFET